MTLATRAPAVSNPLLALVTAALRPAQPTGPRALPLPKRRDYARGEQVGAAFVYWTGLRPVEGAGAKEQEEFQKTLVTDDELGPGTRQIVAAMLGRDPEWDLVGENGDPLAPDDEVVAALADWHREAGVWGTAKEAAHALLWGGRSALRIYIPAEYAAEALEGRQPTLSAALELIHVQAVEPFGSGAARQGGVVLDEYGREVAYAYVYGVAVGDKTEERVEVHTPAEVTVYAVSAGQLTPVGKPAPNPLYDPARRRRPRYLMHELRRDGGSFITPSLVDLQNALNVARSNARRNNDLAGHRQYYTVNAESPTDTGQPDGKPIPYKFGPRKVVDIQSVPGKDGAPLTAEVGVIDPVDAGIFHKDADAYKAALLGHMNQLWRWHEGQNVSGESKRESRAAFDKTLPDEAEPVAAALAWLVETALRLAAWLVGGATATRAATLTCRPRLYLDVSPVDLNTYGALREAQKEGQLSLQALLEATPGVSDAAAEVARIVAERESNVRLALEAFELGAIPQSAVLKVLRQAGVPSLDDAITRAEEAEEAELEPEPVGDPGPVVDPPPVVDLPAEGGEGDA